MVRVRVVNKGPGITHMKCVTKEGNKDPGGMTYIAQILHVSNEVTLCIDDFVDSFLAFLLCIRDSCKDLFRNQVNPQSPCLLLLEKIFQVKLDQNAALSVPRSLLNFLG